MKKTVAILAAGSVMATAAPAMAQRAGDDVFSGVRVGATAGYDNISAGSSIDDDGNDNNDQSADGLLYGGEVGYDIDTGNAVFGVETELTGSTAETEFDDGDFEGFGFGNVSTGRDFYVGVRAGVKATPNTLVYAKGGYTNARFDVRSNDGTVTFDEDIDTDGYRIGAGVERAMASGMYIKGEYRYSNYSRAEVDFGGDLPESDRFDVDTDRHQVVASVGWRF